jgi:hypothetical protein
MFARCYSQTRGDLPPAASERCPIWVDDDGRCAYCDQPIEAHDERAIKGPHDDPRPPLSRDEADRSVAPQVGTRPLMT